MMKSRYALLSLAVAAGGCTQSGDPTPKPVAQFSVPATAETGVVVSASNTSADATSYEWTWGDGATSTDQNATHSFNLTGKFRVLLRASSADGSDTTSRVITITRGGPGAPVLAAAAGSYRGVLYSNVVVSVYPPTFRSSRRDTTLLITALNSNTLQCLGASLLYQPGTAAQPSNPWLGHLPQRNNYSFNNGAPPSNAATLQLEQQGDSCYFYKRVGGLAAGDTYTFYGRKRP